MPWIGDKYVAHVVEQDYDTDRPTDEFRLQDGRWRIEEFPARLSNGDMEFRLTVAGHPESRGLDEQTNAIRSLIRSEIVDNPIEFLNDKGHVSVSGVDINRLPQDNIREGSITLRYLPNEEYKPGMKLAPSTVDNDYGVDTNGLIPLGAAVSSIDGETPVVEEITTLEAARGDLNYFSTDASFVHMEYGGDSYSQAMRQSPIRVINHDTNTRVYRPEITWQSSLTVTNGIVRFSLDNTHIQFDYYDGASWVDVGEIGLSPTDVKILELTPERVRVSIGVGVLQLDRGSFAGKFEVADSSVELDTQPGDYNYDTSYDDTDGADSDVFMWASESSRAYDLLLLKPKSDGEKDATNQVLSLTGDSEKYVGVYPDVDPSRQQISHWEITELNKNRTLYQRSEL